MTRLPVSSVLLCKNHAHSLPAYFASMRDIDDIIMLEGNSTDGSPDIGRAQPNCRVFPQNPKYIDEQGYITDFSSLRNEGYAMAKHPWILCVDADETATPELLAEVRRVVEAGVPGVYYVKRHFSYKGKPVVMFRGGAGDHIRLFHLSCVRGCVRPVHERVDVIKGAPIGIIAAPVDVPLPEPPYDGLRRKFDRFLKIEGGSNAALTYGGWVRWLLLRNTFGIVRHWMVLGATRFIPRRGQRYPLRLEWEQTRYSWLLIWRSLSAIRTRAGSVR